MKIQFLLLFLVGQGYLFAQQAEISFRIPERDLIPEGIAYHAGSQTFFISSIFKNKIIQVSKTKGAVDFIKSNQDGIGQVLGLKIKDNWLWACSNTGEYNPQGESMVHVFDITTGSLIKKWVLKANGDIHLFNDLALTSDGAFVSDSDYSAIYKISWEQEKPELWLKSDDLGFANGIAAMPNGEVVVNTRKGFMKFNQAKELSPLPFSNYYVIGIDGLCYHNGALIGLQNVIYPVSINRYELNSTYTQIDRARVLVADDARWDIPTTGVMVDDWFYFIANSQMRNMDKAKIIDPSKLKDVLIMRVRTK